MIGICKDCKFWRNKECIIARYVDREGRLLRDDFGIYVYARDDSGLTYALRTGPEFGCVRFQSKRKKDVNINLV